MITNNYSFSIIYSRYLACLTIFTFIVSTSFAQKNAKAKVDQMPYLISAECSGKNADDLKSCSNKALLNFVYNNVKYPEAAKKKNLEGKAVINFTINNKGAIQDIKILKDIGSGCGEEAARVIGLMNEKNMKWAPGKKDGKTVAVLFTLPVLFKLK